MMSSTAQHPIGLIVLRMVLSHSGNSDLVLPISVLKQAIHPEKWRENCMVIHGLDVDPSHLLLLIELLGTSFD